MLPGMSPEAIKYRIFEALQALVIETANQQPLVIAIEDLHWVDTITAEFLTFLLDHIAGARVLLVCTYRPDFASAWSGKSYHSVITLTRLGLQDSYRMLASLLDTLGGGVAKCRRARRDPAGKGSRKSSQGAPLYRCLGTSSSIRAEDG